jgi:hypothetical protein
MSDPMKDHCPGSMSWAVEQAEIARKAREQAQKDQWAKDNAQWEREWNEKEARKIQNLMPPPAPPPPPLPYEPPPPLLQKNPPPAEPENPSEKMTFLEIVVGLATWVFLFFVASLLLRLFGFFFGN